MLTGTLAVAPSMIQQPGQSSVFFGRDGAVVVSTNVTQEEAAAVVAFVGKLNMGACVAVLLAAGLAYERERYDKPAHTAYEFVAHKLYATTHAELLANAEHGVPVQLLGVINNKVKPSDALMEAGVKAFGGISATSLHYTKGASYD